MTPETENVIPRTITLSSTQVRVCRHHGVIFSAITTGPLSSSQGIRDVTTQLRSR